MIPNHLSIYLPIYLSTHYQYLDAFDACARACRSRAPPAAVATRCASHEYRRRNEDMLHCYAEATAATAPLSFNVPAFTATVLQGAALKVVVMLRDPAVRLRTPNPNPDP